jgi:hypothetical protein
MKTAIAAVILFSAARVTAGAQEPQLPQDPGPQAEASHPTVTARGITLNLADVLAEVREKNPELKAAAAVSRAYKDRIKQAYVLKDPVIEFERMYTPSGKSFMNDAGERNISISQEIDNPYKLLLRRDAARDEHAFYSSLYGLQVGADLQ